jgi:hypothetical protein
VVDVSLAKVVGEMLGCVMHDLKTKDASTLPGWNPVTA